MLEINKQEMRYSKQGERVTIYKRDEKGNIVYESYKDSANHGYAAEKIRMAV